MEELMDDLISRQGAIDALNTVYNEWQTQEACSALEEATSMIEGLPSAQPEIIRCKDCKNWQTDWTPIFSNFTPEDHFCSLVDLVTEDDFFCGYAERKDNG